MLAISERKNWERKSTKLTELIESIPSIFQLLPVNSSNVQCAHQSRLILKGADNLEIWALNCKIYSLVLLYSFY